MFYQLFDDADATVQWEFAICPETIEREVTLRA